MSNQTSIPRSDKDIHPGAVTQGEVRNDTRYRDLFQQVPVGILEEDYSPVKRFIDSHNFRNSDELWDYCTRNPDEFLETMLKCTTLDINPAGIAAYGAETKEAFMLDHKDFDNWMSYDWVAFYLYEIEALYNGNLPFQREFEDTSVDGRSIIIRCITFFEKGYEHDWSRVMSIIENVTDRKKMESQLQQTQKMDALGRLTEALAQDVNNILAIISGQAEMLDDTLEGNREAIEEIVNAVSIGSGLVKQLMSFSGKPNMDRIVVDPHDIASNLVTMIGRTLPDNISIELNSEKDLWFVEVEPSRLENAILNLVLNSRNAMPEGGRIIVSLSNETLQNPFVNHTRQINPGDYMVTSVVDTGTGMSSGQMRYAFDPLFPVKTQGSSSGLGLSSVFQFASQNGGHVAIFSSQGSGTEIRIYIPKAEHKSGPLLEIHSDYSPRGNGETILMVEDEQALSRLVGSMLDSLGYTVLVARDGLEALDTLSKTHSISLMLTDIQLPGGLSGIEVSKTARHLHPEMKIQFMSGYIDENITDREELEKYGPILNKPFRKAELAQRISQVINPPQTADKQF